MPEPLVTALWTGGYDALVADQTGANRLILRSGIDTYQVLQTEAVQSDNWLYPIV
jgi:hypothetical protein